MIHSEFFHTFLQFSETVQKQMSSQTSIACPIL